MKVARVVTEEELKSWTASGGETYYISHQMAPNPSSKTTPVRVVFNSSQKYKGHSLNNSWELGTDVMNSLHGVLLRFQNDYVGAQGDIQKMFYMIRVTKTEQMMQLFLWRFPGEEKITTFCMTRLVMGHCPSPNLSMVAMHKTASLNTNEKDYPVAYKALVNDSYVDNTFTGAENHEKVREKIEEIETVGAMGGFSYKEWVISGQKAPDQSTSKLDCSR